MGVLSSLGVSSLGVSSFAAPVAATTSSSVGTPDAKTSEALNPANYEPVSPFSLGKIRPKVAVDALAAVKTEHSGSQTTFTVAAISGRPCRAAKKKSTCLRAWNRALNTIPANEWREDFHLQPVVNGQFLVAVRGDRVFAVPTDPSFFGTISSAVEAAWLLRTTAIRSTPPTYVGLYSRIVNDCPITRENRAVELSSNGTIRELARGNPDANSATPQPCI